MTRKQIKDLVYDLLGERSAASDNVSDVFRDERLNDWINEGQNWIYNNIPDEGKLSLTKRFVMTTTTATATYFYALDTGAHITDASANSYATEKTYYAKELSVRYTPTGQGELPMHYIPPDEVGATVINPLYTATSTANPIYTIVETKMWPMPQVTSTTCRIDLWAIVRPRPLEEDIDDIAPFRLATSELAEEYHHILAYYTAAMCKYRDDEVDEGDRLMGIARDELARVTADVTAGRGVQQ